MTKNQKALHYFQEIEFKKPSDIIIEQINRLISTGILKPGDILPSERVLAERFGVGRGYVREAIRKLEFYGILKTLPQRGTVVANIGVKALEGLIANVLNLDKKDMNSLLEARSILEIHAARLAAERATAEDKEALKKTHEEFHAQVKQGNAALEEDLLFHIKIAETSKNSVLRSLISLITPDIITLSNDLDSCQNGRFLEAFHEHEAILDAILSQDPTQAATAMQIHMDRSLKQFNKLSKNKI